MANALNMMDFSPSRENPPASACSMSMLPPEIEEGNIEYKLKLVNPSASRFEHLVTQMKWRLREGQGEAIYEIGVEDNGLLVGLTEEELQASLTTVQMMADKLDATITILRQREVDYDLEEGEPPRKACELLVRRVPDDQQFIDLRVAVLGNVDVGKSTLLGVLTQGELDNGRGRARLNLFRHLHEIQSGRTSSISHEILGFSGTGEVINYSDSQQGCLTAEEICESASKLLTLIDLAGHHKYLKTTISGLTGYSPDFAMLVVSANTGVAGTTREHLGLALALQVPIFVVVSKIDLCPEMITTRTVTQLHRLLTGCRKVPFEIKSDDDAVTAARTFNESSVCPIFLASSVTGQNLDRIKKFLHVLPPSHNSVEQDKLAQELTEYQVDEVYSVPDVGKVVSGTLFRGTVKEHDRLLLGPDECGFFHPVEVHSIHRNRSPCRVVRPGQAATLAVGEWDDRIMLRKGMVLVNDELHPTSCMEFEAEVCVLFHTTMICKGFQATLHIGNVCQTAVLTEMNKPCMKTNEQAQVRFRFIKNPEYLREGSRLLLREGSTKVLGKVTKVYTYSPVDR